MTGISMGGILAQNIFVPGPKVPSCLQAEIQNAVTACTEALDYLGDPIGWLDDCVVGSYFMNLYGPNGPLPSSYNYANFPRGPWAGQNAENPWFAKNNIPRPTGNVKRFCNTLLSDCFGKCGSNSGCISQCQTDIDGCFVDGRFYLTESCEIVKNPTGFNKICDAGVLNWIQSPISLIWEDGTDIEAQSAVVRFKLDPTRSESWYVWKASAKTPLLVHDPEQSGVVTNMRQLFGPWAFGGKPTQIATLTGEDRPQPAAEPWKDGYEALATLDENRDGVLKDEELAVLALWFDRNQDAISQPGEILSLRQIGVTEIYYTPDRRDAASGNIFASRGFTRLADGQIIRGASVDWYGEGAHSKAELVNRIITKAGQCDDPSTKSSRNGEPTEVAATSNDNIQRDVVKTDGMNPTKRASHSAGFGGVWRWKSADAAMPESEAPQGFFVLAEQDGNIVTGHSITETVLVRPVADTGRLVNFTTLTGQTAVDAQGRATVSFLIIADDGTTIRSQAELSVDGKTLLGSSNVKTTSNGRSIALRYAWKATRF